MVKKIEDIDDDEDFDDDEDDEDWDEDDDESEVEEEESPKNQKKGRGRPSKNASTQKNMVPPNGNPAFASYHYPERIGIMDTKTREPIAEDIWSALADILTRLQRIEEKLE